MRGKPWTTEEIIHLWELRILYPVTWLSIASAFPHRTIQASRTEYDRIARFVAREGRLPTAEEVHPKQPATPRGPWTHTEDAALRDAQETWEGGVTALAYRLSRTLHRTPSAILARMKFLESDDDEHPTLPPIHDDYRAPHRRVYDRTPPSAAEWQERRRRAFAELNK